MSRCGAVSEGGGLTIRWCDRLTAARYGIELSATHGSNLRPENEYTYKLPVAPSPAPSLPHTQMIERFAATHRARAGNASSHTLAPFELRVTVEVSEQPGAAREALAELISTKEAGGWASDPNADPNDPATGGVGSAMRHVKG